MKDMANGLLVSNFTIENCAQIFKKDADLPTIEPCIAPYGDVMNILLNPNHPCRQSMYDFALVWTLPGRIFSAFQDMMDCKPVDMTEIFRQVKEYAVAIAGLKKSARFIFVPAWVMPPYIRGLGMLNMKPNIGFSAILMEMNIYLARCFENDSSVFIFDSQQWISIVGEKSYNPKLWFMAKVPFSNGVFHACCKDTKTALRALDGQAKKLVVLDLDDTLWGGIVGDDGWENLSLGGHSFKGEAFVAFQHAIKALKNRGILLAIVSKNQESVALEAIEKHPAMVLRKKDFVGWRINWQDKAQNILDLVHELNLGAQSVVFLDDNPSERARVREVLPEVFIPELPNDPMLYESFMQSLSCFDSPGISREDRERTDLYIAEKKRAEIKQKVGSVDDWLKTLDMQISVQALDKSNLKRTVQLLNKTNQMNLTTRRLSEEELSAWVANSARWLQVVSVSDRLGDFGLVGIVSFEKICDVAYIVDFVLSCRVFGRKIEDLMIHLACNASGRMNAVQIKAVYKETAKNQPCLDFLKNSGFDNSGNSNEFVWDLKTSYPIHYYATINPKE